MIINDKNLLYKTFESLDASDKVQFLKDNYNELDKNFDLKLDHLIEIWTIISAGGSYKFTGKDHTPEFTRR